MSCLLILGGSSFQEPAIRRAVAMGHRVVTCDYLPDNPGHGYAHEYVNVSTTDREAVLDVARSRKVDGVLAYASDPAASVAAHVASTLGLPGCPASIVDRMTDKPSFRAHQCAHGFAVPGYREVADRDAAIVAARELGLPVGIKPCDSSGSKGVSRVDAFDAVGAAFDAALACSRRPSVIVERWITRRGAQIAGDGLVLGGRVVFIALGDENFDADCCDWAPVGETFPGSLDDATRRRLVAELDRLFASLGVTDLVFNLDAMIDEDGEPRVIEIGPRAGGNALPQVIEAHTGVDLTSIAIRLALGEPIAPADHESRPRGCFASWIVHARRDGRLAGYRVDASIEPWIRELRLLATPGTPVRRFGSSRDALGCAVLAFPDAPTMHATFARLPSLIEAVVE